MPKKTPNKSRKTNKKPKNSKKRINLDILRNKKAVLLLVVLFAGVGAYFTLRGSAAVIGAASDSKGNTWGNVKVYVCRTTPKGTAPGLVGVRVSVKRPNPNKAPFGIYALRTSTVTNGGSGKVYDGWIADSQEYHGGDFNSGTGIGVNVRFSDGTLKTFKYYQSSPGVYNQRTVGQLPRC